MNISAISKNTNGFGKSSVDLVKVADTITGSKELGVDTIKDIADCIEIEKDTPKNTKLFKHFLVSLVGAIGAYGAVRAASGRVYNYVDDRLKLPVFDCVGKYGKRAYVALRKKVIPQTTRSFKSAMINLADESLKWSKKFANNSVTADALDKFKRVSPQGNISDFYAKKAAIKAASMLTGAAAAIKSVCVTTRDNNNNGVPDIFDERTKVQQNNTTKGPDLVDVAIKAANLLPG